MSEAGLKAEPRSGTGKGVARKLRAQGMVPGVLYGHGEEPTPLAVDGRSLSHLLAVNGHNVLIDLDIQGTSHLALAREIQRDPIRGSIVHVDLLRVARDEVVTVDVAIHIEGESRGVKEGGVLEHHLWQLHVECLPGNVPERIDVDVANLGVGEVLHVSDVTAPDGVTILTPGDEIIVACVIPQALKVEADLGEPVPEGAAAGAEAGEATGGSEAP